MDKTEMYVGMADCEEVQGHLSGHWDAIISFWVSENVFMDGSGDYWAVKDGYNLNEKIWLPTQDQIQGMITGYSVEGLFNRFYQFWNNEKISESMGLPQGYTTDHIFNSGEQLWLAFYMHEKHNKTWDGEKWVKSDQ